MDGQQNINTQNLNQTNTQGVQPIEVNGEDFLPVFNPLLGAFQPDQNFDESFKQQFNLPWPTIPPKAFDEHLFLPEYKYHRIDQKTLNIFNPQAGFYKQQKKVTLQKELETSKEKDQPHYYDLLTATYTLKQKTQSVFAKLKPVPIVKLDKKEVSYTKEINNILSYSPTSQGTFKATDAMLGLVIGFVLFFLYLRTVFGKQIRLFFRSAFNRVRAVNVFEERGVITGRVSFVLNIFYFLVLGMLGMHLMDYTGFVLPGVNALTLFFILTGIVLSVYILKYIFGRLIGHLLQFNEYTAAFFFHSFVFNKTYAVFVFPLLLIIPYINTEWAFAVLQGTLYLYGLFYILRTFRILILSIQRNVSLFYLFLYLCALEIVPILVVVKIAAEWLRLPVF